MTFLPKCRRVTRSRSAKMSAASLLLLAGLSPLTLIFASSANATPISNPLLGTTLPGFAVLAGSGVTNTGATVITGNMGLAPNPATTGFTFDASPGLGVVIGTVDPNNSAATTAQTDWTTAYNRTVAETPTSLTSATALGGGQSLTAGVYSSSGAIGITGSLTLDGGVPGGISNSIFVFYTAAPNGLTANTGSTVNLINGAQACNVFWAVGAVGAVLDGPLFNGTVLSSSAITLDAGETINGRLLASIDDVTLQDDAVTAPTCATPFIPGTPTPTTACTLTSSLSPSTAGQAVTLTALVTGAQPTGTVTFSDSAAGLGSSSLNGSGQATLTTTGLDVGTYAIGAYYSGDSANAACGTTFFLQTVNAAAPTPSTPTTIAPASPTVTAATTPIATPATGTPVTRTVATSKPTTSTPSSTVPAAPLSPIVPAIVPVTG